MRVFSVVAGGALALSAAWVASGLLLNSPTTVARAPDANMQVARPDVRQIPMDGTPVGSIAPPPAPTPRVVRKAAFPAMERSPNYSGFRVTGGR